MADISPDLFMDAVLAYQQTAAIKAALELDLFSEIGKGNATAESLARTTGAAVRGVRILCDYLTVRGHLEKQGDQYRLTQSTAAFLDRSAPSWMGSVVEYLAAPEMMALFLGDPAAFVRNGGSIGLANNAPDHPIWVKFARAMGPSRIPVATRNRVRACSLVSPQGAGCRRRTRNVWHRDCSSRRGRANYGGRLAGRPFSCTRERRCGGRVGALPHIRGECVRHRLG